MGVFFDRDMTMGYAFRWRWRHSLGVTANGKCRWIRVRVHLRKIRVRDETNWGARRIKPCSHRRALSGRRPWRDRTWR